MINRFRNFIEENGMILNGGRILLAVSGGIDSMVMTHLFLMSGYNIGIAHCNFSLRAEESDQDEELVSRFASEHAIPFYSIRFATKAYARENGISVQMAARELRYDWFEKIRDRNGYHSIAVAHNLNDNIETLLINLTRGTGLTGLTGMRPVANRIIRPLLFATRQEIQEYSISRSITFREDRSNADTKYLRNKIRHKIIPLLMEINPSIESTLNETIGILTGSNEIISDYIRVLGNRVSEQKGENLAFNIVLLLPHIHNKAVLFELFRPYGIGDVPLNDLTNIIRGKTGGQLITGSHRIVKNRDELLVTALKNDDQTIMLIKNQEDLETVPRVESVKSVVIESGFKIPTGPNELCIDYDKLTFPLTIRTWNTGDFFYPLGFNHKKKLSDYFIDNKYSIFDKDRAMILECEGRIVCILGDRIDNRFRITESSRNAMIIRTVSGFNQRISITDP